MPQASTTPQGLNELRPILSLLYITPFLIDDWLAGNDFFGASQVALMTASSKTASRLAFALSQWRPDGPVVLAAVLGLWAAALQPAWLVLALLVIFLCGVWIHDLLQTRRAVFRNYPMIGHFRYLLEGIRAENRKYFTASDSDELPLSRRQRSIVYQRAKSDLDKQSFCILSLKPPSSAP